MHIEIERLFDRFTQGGRFSPEEAAERLLENHTDPVSRLAEVWMRAKSHSGFALSDADRKTLNDIEHAGDDSLWSVRMHPNGHRSSTAIAMRSNGRHRAYSFHETTVLVAPNLTVHNSGAVALWGSLDGRDSASGLLIPCFPDMHAVMRDVVIVPFHPEEGVAATYPDTERLVFASEA